MGSGSEMLLRTCFGADMAPLYTSVVHTESGLSEIHWRILGFTAEYSKSVIMFTTTYVKPIANMHPCTR